MADGATGVTRQATEYQRIRAAESRIEFTTAGIMTLLIAGTLVYVYTLFEPIVPRFNLMLWTGMMAAITLVLIIVPLTVLIRRPDDLEIATVWARVGKVVTALFDIAVASGVWLLLPYASEQLQLLMVIFFCATISAQVISAAESIDNIAFAVVSILGSTALFFLQNESTYAVSLSLFLLAYGVLMVGVAFVLRYAMRSAIVSRLKAEDISAELAVALEQAQKARDDRTTFIAAASHDLRQPIQAAMLFFQQLLLRPGDSVRARAEDGVRQAFQEANALLDRMLEHLRLESGTMPLAISPVELAPLIATLAGEHEVIARNAGMRLCVFGGSHWVMADPHLLTRILRNLLHNGFTHAHGDRVCMLTRAMGDRVRLYVIDDGIGIAEDGYFQPYVQGTAARGKAQGMGLGLAVSREMARLMGGDLAVDRRWTGGTALYVDLPMLAGGRSASVAPNSTGVGRAALTRLRIVVIDDDDGARVALADLLGMIAVDVRAVATVAELDALMDFHPDLIVSDWHLDGGQRGDAAIAVAQRRWPGIAAIFITGDGSPETLQIMSSSHIPVLWKPTDIDALGALAASQMRGG